MTLDEFITEHDQAKLAELEQLRELRKSLRIQLFGFDEYPVPAPAEPKPRKSYPERNCAHCHKPMFEHQIKQGNRYCSSSCFRYSQWQTQCIGGDIMSSGGTG